MTIEENFSQRLPEYHEGQLIVKLRPSASPVSPLGASSFDIGGVLATPGMATLSMFENAGLVKRVIPLSAPPITSFGSPLGMMSSAAGHVMSALAASVHPSVSESRNAGVSIIELQRDRDLGDLQIALAQDPNVEYVSRVPIRYLAVGRKKASAPKDSGTASKTGKIKPAAGAISVTANPPTPSSMWNLQKILWEQAVSAAGFKNANDIKVAVLDSGVERDHPDLIGQITQYLFSYPGIQSASGDKDLIGHGTHVAGTIAAISGNTAGINGICRCQLHAYKIFDDTPDFDSFNYRFVYYVDTPMYHRALAECLEQKVDVINLSIGGGGVPDPNEKALFQELLANGTTVVAAMGNERLLGSPISYPAAIPGVIAVGATGINDSVASFSNRGSHISLSAPGVAIWSTLPTYAGQSGFAATPGLNGKPIRGLPFSRDTDYAAWNGTSMASPHVAAAAALVLAKHGNASPAEVRAILLQNADRVAGMMGDDFHPDFGAGRLNLSRLLQ